MSFALPPSDPLFSQSWHLANTGQGGGTAGFDIRALSAWKHYTGRGVLVGVLYDGVELSHPDLAANAYVRPGNVVLVNPNNANLVTGLPVQAGDSHGTSAAGVIAPLGRAVPMTGRSPSPGRPAASRSTRPASGARARSAPGR